MTDASGAFLYADPRRDDDRPQLRIARRVVGGGFGRHARDEAGRQPARDLFGIVAGNRFRDADEIEVARDRQQLALREEAFEIAPVDLGGFAEEFGVERAVRRARGAC